MEDGFNPGKIEKKWQNFWQKQKLSLANDKSPNNYYCLIEFPYVSGDGLHVGHLRSYTAIDIMARKKRMEGKNVLFPIGFDSFGLPTENYAIKVKRKPQDITRDNIANFTRQLKAMGFSFDWDRQVDTSDPKYYKWTQWIFLQLYKAGLVYQKEMPINWCPSCKIGLANEEVVTGKCERCGSVVSKKNQKQWLFKITKYSDRLISDLDKVDYLEKIKLQQINWIGRSEGANVKFQITSTKSQINSKLQISNPKRFIQVFTTRPDTLYGVTYMVLSPEHELIAGCLPQIVNRQEVEEYIKKAKAKSDLERTESKEKIGVELKGIKAINPVNQQEIPIWIADYVLTGYGTGAIMAVPGHDERDFEFAKKYDLSVINVIEPVTGTPKKNEEFRRSIVALVKNPKNGKFLSVNWGDKLGGNLFIGGGLEKEEDPIKCALREIEEETGYKNFKFIAQSEKIHHHYRAYSKGVNREIEATGLFFELVGHDKGKMDLKTEEKFKIEWLTAKEAEQRVEDPLHHYVFEKFVKNKIYAGEGTMMNSGKYDGMDSVKFKEVIIKELNSTAGQITNTCLIVHGYSGHKRENWFPWLKEELNKSGWETIVPTMPGAGHPTLESWDDYLNQYNAKVSENSILIGHSIGCASVLHYLQGIGKKVDTVILVAPTNPLQKWTKLKRDRPDVDWESIKNMNEESEFNWMMIQTLAKRFIILHSDDDPFIPAESMEYYRKNLPQAEIHLIPNKDHFSESHGIKSLPEILPFIPENPSMAAKPAVNYKLRDWIFSRQHYWGEPIPLIHCEKCGVVPVPEKDLPVLLPEVENYEPTNTGQSPLAKITDWVNVECPNCGGPAKRETDTMPNWAGSNWYFIRYCDPHNDKAFADMKKMKHWLPVDLYNGGMEHTTLHLLYSRFWYKALYDLKLVPTDEPYQRRVSHGMVLAEDGKKMSKSFGNVVNPDVIIKEFGADAVRLYEMFMGPFDQAINWNTDGLRGTRRFLDKIWKIFNESKKGEVNVILNKTIKKVTEDIDHFRFNTCISSLMILVNEMSDKGADKATWEKFLIILSPFAPHLAEELWETLGHKQSIFKEKWPTFDPKLVKDEEVEFIIQVNGKLRDRLKLPVDISEDEAKEKALNSEKVKKYVSGEPKKVVFVKGRLINFVV